MSRRNELTWPQIGSLDRQRPHAARRGADGGRLSARENELCAPPGSRPDQRKLLRLWDGVFLKEGSRQA
eukprot:9913756-Alexandrium_andersonii.AAC.1